MDQVQEMMEGLAICEGSPLYWYVDLDYEFDACQFFDFSTEETRFDVEESERWFSSAPEYPPAPYMMKINLGKLLKSTPVEVHTTPSFKSEAVEHTSSTKDTPSDCDMHLSEGTAKDSSDMKYHNLLADIEKFRAKLKPTNRVSKPGPNTTFTKSVATRLAKKSNAGYMQAISSVSSSKSGTPAGSEAEDTKRQKLQIGFLRKVSQLKHQISFSHKATTKATIPRTLKLKTEERAQIRRSFKSQGKAEANNHTFKALPLNRKIFDSPSLPSHKKSTTQSCEFQKHHLKHDI